jgi:hypothetical protein
MDRIEISASKIIQGKPTDVYAVMSDYQVGHPTILPKSFFSKSVVIEGGKGAGTVIEVHMDVYGSKRVFHHAVTESEPGHILVETDKEADVATSFTVEPTDNSNQSRVTIVTKSRLSPGIQGLLERLFNPLIISRIYRQELELLDQYIRRQSTGGPH